MNLLTLQDAQLAFGDSALLDRCHLSIEEGERIGLIGRNGAGKSSLLKILARMEHLDDGQIQTVQQLKIAYVPQEPVLTETHTVHEEVKTGLAQLLGWIDAYTEGSGDMHVLQDQIEAQDGWNWAQRVEETIQRLGLDPEETIAHLSGGKRKRVALAKALVERPQLLLLDEPTNHLDMGSITWLEDLLLGFKGTVITISHDRAFLDRITTRIVELDRGKLITYEGNFSTYQTLKAEQLAYEATVSAKADKLLAQEEVWIRKGVEARRTRAQGRINRLHELRESRAARRNAVGQVKLDVASGAPSGKIVADLDGVSKAFAMADGGSKTVIHNLTCTLLRGDKIGLIGPNGAGKSTLLKIILGELQADSGTVRRGTNLSVAYFDQMREQIDMNATLEDFISPGSEWIEVGNKRTHVRSYLGDFLFSPARALSPVRSLSGGERNRLLLARLFAKPVNVLVLDEPTNDLDIDTIELLEDLLQQYVGTVFLVSHDRRFLDNVVTSTLVAEGAGLWREYEGDVSDWLAQSARAQALAEKASESSRERENPDTRKTPVPEKTGTAKRKLSYKEQRLLQDLPLQIAALETEQTQLQNALADGQLYTQDPEGAARMSKRLVEVEEAWMAAMEQLQALETAA